LTEDTTIDTWRSETLTALLAYEGLANHRQGLLHAASTSIFLKLSSVFPVINLDRQSFARFYNKVMFPAADLASIMQTSSSVYDFEMPTDMVTDLVQVHIGHLATFRLVEMQTRKTLKPDSKVVPDRHGHIGKVILPLEPRLYRKNRGQQSTTLCQACYLVKLDRPLLKDNQALS